jgi:shikimate kinase
MENIYLVGFMGSGKTDVARALALDLGRSYISVDELIVEKEGRPITDIFRDDKEPYFREVEKRTLEAVSRCSAVVVDTGGGAVLDPENIRTMKETGTVICLWADPETIYERVKDQKHRPLLNVGSPRARIEELLRERRPFYEKADHSVDTSGLSVPEVVDRIKKIVIGENDKRI